MEIIDDFLEQRKFDELQTLILGPAFGWWYNDRIDYKEDVDKYQGDVDKYQEDVDKYQFTHLFYGNGVPRSPEIDKLKPILEIIQPMSILRIKANLLTKTPNIVENAFHVDINGVSEEKKKQVTTSIFYINTNNGYTKFEDGTVVESIANRMVTFPANLKHRGTSCTDEKIRVVINFNYFK